MLVKKKFLISLYLALFSFLVLSIFAIRNPYLISDGDNYVMHATMDIDFSAPIFFTSSLYWVLVEIVSLHPVLFPGFLSLLIAILISLTSLKLKPIETLIFIFFIIVNPMFFTTFELALRNGLALSLFIFLVSYGKDKFSPIVCLIHPGMLPVVALFLGLRYLKFSLKNIIFFVFGVSLLIFLFYNFFDVLLASREYSGVDNENSASFLTYLFFLFLSIIYYKSFNSNKIKFYMPLFYLFWVVLGFTTPFAARVFVQAVPFFVIIIFLYSDNVFYRRLFLITMFVFTIILSIKLHPFITYNNGWVDTWVAIFNRYF